MNFGHKSIIEEKTKDLRGKVVNRNIVPYTFNDIERDIIQTSEGLKTGYQNLDKFIRIPQGAITLIAGKPSHGKTTLLMNFCLNMTDIYKDKRFFFFSYEEIKSKIALKLLNILSGEVIDKNQNTRYLSKYIKNKEKNRPKIEEGKRKYDNLTENGRLWIIDEPYYVNDLADTITYLKETYDNIGAIFIDYIQKVKIRGKFNTRQLEIQKISERILEIAKSLSLPIILGVQVNRGVKSFKDLTLDKLREAGDLEQDPNLVIGLYNEAKEKLQEKNKDESGELVDLDIRLLKNRDGEPNREFILYFNTPILRITDKPSGQSVYS